jgi:hypothetical protein
MEWNGPATNVNASQSCRFSEEKKSPSAWNGCGLVDFFQAKCVIARKSGKGGPSRYFKPDNDRY